MFNRRLTKRRLINFFQDGFAAPEDGDVAVGLNGEAEELDEY